MLHALRHIAPGYSIPAFTRFIALLCMILPIVIRMAALLHTHHTENTDTSITHSQTVSYSPLSHTDSTAPHSQNTSDTHHETCPLCDTLTTNQSESAFFQAILIGIVVISVFVLVSASPFRTASFALRLADRAPPALLALV